ncbi:thioredoxin domain-containing protein [Pengzhenrongella sicca]|uniref:Thioredoxin domain-containing protein n=1 Tax=Pengzhenrongella sicca TaxID=2819238 RepID=A0A8A4Z8X6_9MICO|nr:thioredoxin domain-containing protein [Pengzhenrongella sicca]QTE28304.1 thioredoxin domain-containing protein [Pengzhenrongella sicca]
MANRLAASTSPYLLQHAHNPVDWREWGPAAFAEARRRDVPLLISVGYAACHWCHVMAHESFEDEATASAMNAQFVCVKVDREERPDVDAVYLAATQEMTGSGGWPMTVFATPAGEPFYCGTYFPPRPVGGQPSFGQLLAAITAAWRDQRGALEQDAGRLRRALADRPVPAGPDEFPAPAELDDLLAGAFGVLAGQFDPANAGFGPAPKFPPSMALEWLLRRHARTGDPAALALAERTLEAMARGGLYDQLGGGFARYSVDAGWVVPHFEKMLYDNALLLRVYAHWWRATGSPLAERVVTGTVQWLLRELRTPEGGLASSLDADSDSHEGTFYVWTPAELAEVLGADDGAWAAQVWSVTAAGTFERGSSVLQLRADPDPADAGRHESVRARLEAARAARTRPARDDKVVAAWNGLAIAALAEAGALLGRPDWVDAAVAAAELTQRLHVRADGAGARLRRTSRAGVAGASPGTLEDYADLAEGLLALAAVTADHRWFTQAGALLETVLTHFAGEPGTGAVYDTADDETDPVLARIRRPQDPADGPTPSGAAAAAGALLTYAALTGSTRHRAAAERILSDLLAIGTRYPRAAGWALAVAEAVADGPREIAVLGPASDARTRALVEAALRATAPGAVLAVGDPNRTGDPASAVPLLRDRPLLGGLPTAYVCRGFVCDLPTTSPADLATTLGTRATS